MDVASIQPTPFSGRVPVRVVERSCGGRGVGRATTANSGPGYIIHKIDEKQEYLFYTEQNDDNKLLKIKI